MYLQSLSGKLAIVLVLLTCTPLLIMGVTLSYMAQDHVLDQAEVRLEGIASSVDSMLAPNLKKMMEHDPSLGLARRPADQQDAIIRQSIAMVLHRISVNNPQILVGFRSSSSDLVLAMVDGEEKVLKEPIAEKHPQLSEPITGQSKFMRQSVNRRYLYTAPVVRDGALIGQIIACAPDSDVLHAVLWIRLTTVITLLIAVLAAWWVARYMAKYLVSHLFAAVRQVAAGAETAPPELSELAPLWGFLHTLMDAQSPLATDLLDAIPVGVVLYNRELRVAYTNEFYSDMLGLDRDKLIGISYEELTHRIVAPEDLPNRVLPVVHSGQAQMARQRQTLISSSSNRIPVESVAFPFGTAQGPQGVVCLINDLRQDEDLARTRKILSFINDVGPVGMVTLDRDGTITEFNHAMTRICSISRAEALGQKIGELFPSLKVDPHGMREYRNQTISCPCERSGQDSICPCSHQGRHLVVDGTITRDRGGNVISIILVFRDITQLREMESRLHEALQQAQFLLDALDVGVVAVDRHGRITVFNQVAESATGLTSTDIHGEEISKLSLAPELGRLLLDATNEGNPHRNHIVSWKVNGEKHEFILDCSPLRDANGTIAGAMAMFRDITTLRKLEHEVQRSEKLSVVGQLAAGTAHEIRNPLTTVRGFLQVLREKCLRSGWEHEVSYIDLMLSEIDRINHVISEFLVLAKDRPAMLQILGLDGLLTDISAILESEALLRGINLITELPDQTVSILGDREQLKQVFLNLATNAFQAMNAGGSLKIKMYCSQDKVMVELSDTGSGIPPEIQAKIFDPFFTTKEEGTGLGLAICNRIVQDHHGEISVTSSPGEGTTMTVKLPLRRQESPSPLAPSPS